jgi:dienelactone hydrolase
MKDSTTTFELPGAAGEVIRGYVHMPMGEGRVPVALLAHGFKGFADYGFLPVLADRLAAAGIAVVRFSFSHCGITEDPDTFDRPDLFERDTYGNQIDDTLAVIAAIHDGTLPGAERMDGERIGMVGHSRGGVTAILATGATDALRVVVTLAAPDRPLHDGQMRALILAQGRVASPSGRTGEMLYVGRPFIEDIDAAGDRYDMLKLVASFAKPFMAAHGQADETVPCQAAENLAAAHTTGPTELVIIPRAGHTFDFKHGQSGSTPALDTVAAKVITFMAEHLT